MNFQTPEAGLGLGLILGCIVALVTFWYMRRENEAWRRRYVAAVDERNYLHRNYHDALDENDRLLAENGRLRQDNARLNAHPAMRFDQQADVALMIAKQEADILAAVAPVYPLHGSVPQQGGGSK